MIRSTIGKSGKNGSGSVRIMTETGGEIPLWNIWIYYVKELQMQEGRQRQFGEAMPGSPLFSEKFMKRGGSAGNNEEDD